MVGFFCKNAPLIYVLCFLRFFIVFITKIIHHKNIQLFKDMSKTNILEETLAEIQELRKAVSENANHALKSTLKEELEEIVKNNLEEVIVSEELSDDMPGSDLPGDLDKAEEEEVLAIEPEDEESEEEKPEGEEPEGEESEEDSEEVIDLTDESDEDVIKHFELMNPADEIEIIQTPEGGVQININPEEGAEEESEEALETSEEEPTNDTVMFEPEELEESNEVSEEPEVNMEEEKIEEEEPVHEIEISEEDIASLAEINSNEEVVAEEEVAEEEIEEENIMVDTKEKELRESLVIMRKKYQEVVSENNKKTEELVGFKNLTEEFKGSEAEYKSAIKNLKSQLQEVALFSSNLTYAIKLITENSTTKDEKLEILNRFDNAENLNESREIFNSMQMQFGSNKIAAKQMVEEKIMETPKSSGSSKLNESTAYQDPQLSRILDIIGKIK